MLKNLLFVLAAVALAGSIVADEFEVQVGARKFTLKDGEPQAVTTPGGEEIRLVVTRKAVQNWSDGETSFSYSNEMKVSTDSELGIKTISVEDESSVLCIIQIYPSEVELKELSSTLLEEMRGEYASIATFPQNPVSGSSRMISGIKRIGTRLRFSIAGLRHELEIYTFKLGTKTMAVMIQADHEDREKGEKKFKIISDSLK